MPRARRKNLSVPEQIDLMVKRIVSKFHPEKIILFGSQARGDAGPDSDVDLLVVMDFEGSKLHKTVEVGVAPGKVPDGYRLSPRAAVRGEIPQRFHGASQYRLSQDP